MPQKVWGQPYSGFQQTVPCPFCRGTPAFDWNVDLSGDELRRALISGADREGTPRSWPLNWRKVLGQGRFLGLGLGPADRSGRIADITLVWSWELERKSLGLSAVQLRNWVGPARIKSTAFWIKAQSTDRLQMSGRGNGHGVGMCQWGAKVMGDRGFKMASILKQYYPGAVLKKLW